jgi:two-component system response regulator YesN
MWNTKGKVSRHRLFLRLLVPNVLLLLFLLIVGWIIYNQTLLMMEKEIEANNMSLLQQTRDQLDRRFAEISSVARQFANDTRIMQFQRVTQPFEGANVFRVMDTHKSLYNINLTNNFIFNYFVIFKNSELVLTQNSTYGIPEFYKYFHYKNMDRQAWENLFIGDYYDRKLLPAQDVTTNGNTYSLLTYLQSLGFSGYTQGVVAVTVDNQEIRKLLGGFDLSEGGDAYIIDDKGSIISSASAGASETVIDWLDRSRLIGNKGSLLKEIGSQKMMITYATSNYNGWMYLVIQPASVVLGKVLYIKKITFSMASLFMALGIVLAYMIAYRNSRPLKGILEIIVERTALEANPRVDVYRFIRDSVSRLIDNNHKLQEEMKKQIPFLQAAYFEKLLKGEYLSSHDTPVLFQHVGIAAQGKYFVTVILQLLGYGSWYNRHELKELDARRVMLKDILRQALLNNEYLHDAAEDQIVILFSFSSDDHKKNMAYMDEVIERVGEMIHNRLNTAARFSVGGMYEGLLNVARSYEEARRTLEYQIWGNKKGNMKFEELPKENTGYHYPPDVELRLTYLTKAGERNAVEMLLKELYDINFSEKQLSATMLQLFMSEVWGTVVKLLPQVSIDEGSLLNPIHAFTGEANGFEGLETNYETLIATYHYVCDIVNEHKKSQNVQLMEKIVRLLNDSYMQTDLCLDAVANRFNISKGYLSQFFKEQTGVNFSDYLENLRMTQAKESLLNTDLPVHEIAIQSGYSSSNTFCRAFKRIYGISTTEYRRSELFLKVHS